MSRTGNIYTMLGVGENDYVMSKDKQYKCIKYINDKTRKVKYK